MIDLRSDTVTLPTKEMLESVLEARLGDDVSREDETVNTLEETAAKLLGKEAGLLVTSGTQGNLVSIMTHTTPGDEVYMEAESHVYYYEVGGLSAIAGVIPHLIPGNRGQIPPETLEEELRPPNIHFPNPRLVVIENTHNRAGGTVIPQENIKAIADISHDRGLSLHIDGARIFNAAVALNVDVAKLVEPADSITFCLSKGLSAPVGSVIVGSEEFIEKARKYRKMLGGGMRQAGIIAAPGLVALKTMIERLREDHENARILAENLTSIENLKVWPVETNIVIVDLANTGYQSTDFLQKLEKRGVRAVSFGKTLVRFTTHRMISKEDVLQASNIIASILESNN